MDTWNPHLDDIEREALAALVAGIKVYARPAIAGFGNDRLHERGFSTQIETRRQRSMSP